MSKFAGQVALITGGANGIGKGTAEVFLENNMKVCIADIDVAAGQRTLEELQDLFGSENVLFQKLDVTNEEEFEDVFTATKSYFGHVDILINNAGILNEIDWKKMIDINLVGVMNGIELAHKYLENSNNEKGGTVINTASVAGIYSLYFLPGYCMTKHGVVAVSISWGNEENVKNTNVKVNAVCPDVTDTAILTSRVQLPNHQDAFGQVINAVGDKKLTPKDIGNAMLKVLEDGVTGSVLIAHHAKGNIYYEPPAFAM